MTHAFDIAIIGGGIVGLATALSLSDRYPAARLVILDEECTARMGLLVTPLRGLFP